MPSVPVILPAANEPFRLLAVHAHPDDESSKGAASTAMYVQQGVEVMVVTCTGGERGDVLNSQCNIAGQNIADVRRSEMANAAQILGVKHRWLGFIDSGFPEGDPLPELPQGCFAQLPLDEVVTPLVEIVRDFKPHVITTYDENGGYPHPDHIRTHEIAVRAWELAADAAHAPQGEPWAVAKLYYHHSFNYDRVLTLHQACEQAGLDSPFQNWLANWNNDDATLSRVTTRVHCADWFTVRDEALKAHVTQIDPDGDWFAVPRELERELWPTEDFELALSRLDQVGLETDLFHGLRGN